ncbi:PTS ascorbate transporter subunit IIC [Spiroplasma clarkii]|uniref:Ascorbate-specific PTS system EIIC component n=1 Tax=Spiroplasma clarkii TaxID=2139 RepID=A0A1Y0L024_9MOLU|nr:PTS ascorbate transporter subunit IIC [Spiroplasma clarkii]ARU91347.1 PTS ascorbate transporter subunit IIC [Spiroplasma clarkii]ATX70770.1 PTS system, ascorbate-specific IIC component [Spiroplasma clarkii]
MWFVNFLKEFIGAPAILLGLFALLGCILQKKGFTQTLTATLKTIIGFVVMQAGAAILTLTLTNLSILFQELFGLTGAIPLNEATAAILAEITPKIVAIGSLIMIFAMLVNILLAKFSRFKYIYLSGHCLFYMSVMLAGTASMVGILNINTIEGYIMAVVTGALCMGIYMTLQPAMLQKRTKQITNSDKLALAHTGAFGYLLSANIGELIYKIRKGKVKSTESIKFPKGLAIFRNTTIAIAILMFIIYMAIYIPVGIKYELGKIEPGAAYSILSSGNWLVNGMIGGIQFAAAVEIILLGVRTFIAEIVPAFKGVSQRMIKDSKPGVDCPVVFPYAPNAVIIGFISAFAGALVAMGISFAIGFQVEAIVYIVLPSIMNIFFQGGTSAVYGNIKGGILGAIIGPFIQSIIFHLVPIIFLAAKWLPEVSDASTLNQVGWGDTDYLLGAFSAIFGFMGTAGGYVYLGVLAAVVVGLIVDGTIKDKKIKKLSLTAETSAEIKTEKITKAAKSKEEQIKGEVKNE